MVENISKCPHCIDHVDCYILLFRSFHPRMDRWEEGVKVLDLTDKCTQWEYLTSSMMLLKRVGSHQRVVEQTWWLLTLFSQIPQFCYKVRTHGNPETAYHISVFFFCRWMSKWWKVNFSKSTSNKWRTGKNKQGNKITAFNSLAAKVKA